MFSPNIKLRVITDGSKKAAKNFDDLSKLAVYVGIPESSSSRRQHGITNAQLAFIHTHGVRMPSVRHEMASMKTDYLAAQELYLRSRGSMAMAIPPRPIIEPAIEAKDNQAAILLELREGAEKQLDGKHNEAVSHMKRAGQEAENRVKAWFFDPRNNWLPDKPATVRRKGSSRPLIDTAQLYNSIRWILA